MGKPQVLVIIPTFGHFDYAERAAWSLVKNQPACDFIAEYVVVDDASAEWATVNWSKWPTPICLKTHFASQSGLTRSWNAGLLMAAERTIKYAICTNSDVLFSQGWFEPLAAALSNGFDLVGPVSNAPGHARWQDVTPFCHPNNPVLDDADEHIDDVVKAIRAKSVGPIEAPINGFFMMAETETWWSGAFSSDAVFDPHFPMLHNEVELQRRWVRSGLRVGFSPQSYIFHYRSVSRPEGLAGRDGKGAYRTFAK
jgi:GT2 family glycosyltransferase